MRVLIITPFPPKLDGIGAHTRSLVRALLATGDVDVEVLAQRRPAGADVHVHHVLSGLRRNAVSEAVRRARPDIVHIQFAVPALGPSALAAFAAAARERSQTGCRLVVTCHEVRRELDLLRGIGRRIYRRIVDTADLIVVHSTEARQLLVDECAADPARVVCLPLGAEPAAGDVAVDPDAARAAARAELGLTGRPFLLHFGFLHPDKGAHLAIEALTLGRRCDAPDAELVVAGSVRPRTGVFRWFERADHAYERELHEAVERHGLGDRVRFIGFVPDHLVGGLFAAARAVVMPCTAVTQSSVAGLATSHGVPVVASDLPGLREAFGDGALLVPVGDVRSLADALAAVVSDDDLAAGLAAAQRRRAREVALPVVAASLVGCYREVLDGHARVEAVKAHG